MANVLFCVHFVVYPQRELCTPYSTHILQYMWTTIFIPTNHVYLTRRLLFHEFVWIFFSFAFFLWNMPPPFFTSSHFLFLIFFLPFPALYMVLRFVLFYFCRFDFPCYVFMLSLLCLFHCSLSCLARKPFSWKDHFVIYGVHGVHKAGLKP